MNKKGTTMVEAAVIFPLIILSVIAVIFILGFMYNEVAADARMHVALNAKMGQETETVITYDNVPIGIKMYKSQHNFSDCWFADEQLNFENKSLLLHSFTKTKESRVYEVNEKKMIRYIDFFK